MHGGRTEVILHQIVRLFGLTASGRAVGEIWSEHCVGVDIDDDDGDGDGGQARAYADAHASVGLLLTVLALI